MSPTYDEVAEHCLQILVRGGILPKRHFSVRWDAFSRLSEKVHRHFIVPSTTFTSPMRHLLFLLTSYTAPKSIVGAGTFVGYTFAWLIRDADDSPLSERPRSSVGLDIDTAAVGIAERNCSVLNHGAKLSFLARDAVGYLVARKAPVDCLYIDVDAPGERKDVYIDVVQAALPCLRSGALILAHDPCVPMFSNAFSILHDFISHHDGMVGPVVLPIDNCGLSVARIV